EAATFEGATKLLNVALAEIADALQVLAEGGLHENAVPHLEQARQLTESAVATQSDPDRNALIVQAIAEEKAARARMVVEPTVTIRKLLKT
ncbi:MAG: hypothetical protein L0Y56_16545, partial [Nitrospira sp.]|nr:hypothetical protein [Nitrospira sp.]